MLYLENSQLIGTGEDRECYQHPEDYNKCVKVTVSGDYKQSNDEIKFYRLMKKRGASCGQLAAFHGLAETSLGQGLVFTLIRDYDGKVSKSLGNYLSSEDYSLSDFEQKLETLNRYLFDERLIIRDLSPDNVLYQKTSEGDGKLIIIDGVGNNEFIPFSTYIDCLARKKIIRKWDRFEALLLREYGDELNGVGPEE